MTQPTLQQWLARKPKGRAPKKPIPKRTKKRAAEERRYRKLAKEYLAANPVCEVWLKENGWVRVVGELYHKAGLKLTTTYMLLWLGAPRSEQVHHRAKRRGAMLCNTTYFLAVSAANHRRIEENLKWAREQGFSLNF